VQFYFFLNKLNFLKVFFFFRDFNHELLVFPEFFRSPSSLESDYSLFEGNLFFLFKVIEYFLFLAFLIQFFCPPFPLKHDNGFFESNFLSFSQFGNDLFLLILAIFAGFRRQVPLRLTPLRLNFLRLNILRLNILRLNLLGVKLLRFNYLRLSLLRFR
jgi:hypothetical protein